MPVLSLPGGTTWIQTRLEETWPYVSKSHACHLFSPIVYSIWSLWNNKSCCCVVHLSSHTPWNKHLFNFQLSYWARAVPSNYHQNLEWNCPSRAALHMFHRKLKLLKAYLGALNREKYSDIPRKTHEAFNILCTKEQQTLLNPDVTIFESLSEVSNQ